MSNSEPIAKYVQIAERLRQAIQSGVYAEDRLPSIRELAKDYAVSVVTASRALQILRDEGMIRTPSRSRGYLVPPTSESLKSYWGICLHSTPGPYQHAGDAVTLEGFHTLNQNGGEQFQHFPFPSQLQNKERRVRYFLRQQIQQGMRGLFFLPSRISEQASEEDAHFLAICRMEQLGVVLLERNLRGADRDLDYDLAGTDDLAGGRICTQHLLDSQRYPIAFVIGSPSSSHHDRLSGYLHALWLHQYSHGLQERNDLSLADGVASNSIQADLPPYRPIVLMQSNQINQMGNTKEVYSSLVDELLQLGVRGVICYHDYIAVGVLMELLRRGIRVPDEIAVVGFENMEIGDIFSIGITTFAVSSLEIANHALALMKKRIQRPSSPPVKVLVPGRLIIRESSCKNPK